MNIWAGITFRRNPLHTILTALVVAIIVSWRSRRLILGPVVAITWAASYEILYGWTNVLLHGWSITQNVWQTAALMGWLLFAYVWKVRLDRRTTILFIVLWLAWMTTGLNSNYPFVAAPFDLVSEALNVATKICLAVCFLIGTLKRSH